MKHFATAVTASAVALAVSLLVGPSLAAENAADAGLAVYKRANCVGCHKWHGGGGGGHGGSGLSRDALGKTPLAQGGVFLKPDEIDAVADYVVQRLKGKGDPNLADCVAFYGENSSACEVYKPGHHHEMPTPSTTQ